MRVQSIRATIQVGHIAGNRLFCLAVQMALRKMHAIAECHYLAQEIRTMAEALQYPRHLLPSRVRAPFVIDFDQLAGGIGVFNEVDLVRYLLFHHGFVSFVISWLFSVQCKRPTADEKKRLVRCGGRGCLWCFLELAQGPLSLEPLKDKEAVNAERPDGKHDDEGQHVRCIENQANPEGPTLAFAGGKAQTGHGEHPCSSSGTQEQGIGFDQLSSIKRKKVDESDVDKTKQADGKQPRPEGGKSGGDEKVHAVGLDVIAEFNAARFFSSFVFFICTACADVEGLHRVDIMHQDSALFNEKSATETRRHGEEAQTSRRRFTQMAADQKLNHEGTQEEDTKIGALIKLICCSYRYP